MKSAIFWCDRRRIGFLFNLVGFLRPEAPLNCNSLLFVELRIGLGAVAAKHTSRICYLIDTHLRTQPSQSQIMFGYLQYYKEGGMALFDCFIGLCGI